MSNPDQRFRSISRTRHFLKSLTDPKRVPNIPTVLREEAQKCLTHYPTPYDMDEAIYGLRLAAQVFAAIEPIPRGKRRPPKNED